MVLRSIKALIGLPVRLQATGRDIGIVRDFCIDPPLGRLSAVLITTTSLIRTSYLIYWQDILSVSHEALFIEARGVLREVKEASDHWWSSQRAPGVWGREIRSETGEIVGLVGDILVDHTGRITGCRVSDGVLMDLLQGQMVFASGVAVSDDGETLTLSNRTEDL